jgi:uncharacterized membrane protein
LIGNHHATPVVACRFLVDLALKILSQPLAYSGHKPGAAWSIQAASHVAICQTVYGVFEQSCGGGKSRAGGGVG